MAINLSKNTQISLKKEDGNQLQVIEVGLGWDMASSTSGGGFLKSMFGSSSTDSIDLDASILLFNESKNLIDKVYFGKKQSNCSAIIHSGDNLTGEGDGDDETIKVDLRKVNANAKYLVVTLNSFRGQNFSQVQNAFCNIYDVENGKKAMYNINLSNAKNENSALIVGVFIRENNQWEFKNISEFTNGKVAEDLAPTIIKLI